MGKRKNDCRDCGTDISHRAKNAIYCKECVELRQVGHPHKLPYVVEPNTPITKISDLDVTIDCLKFYFRMSFGEYRTAKELEKMTGVAIATIYRFVERLHLMGWILSKFDFAKNPIRDSKVFQYRRRFRSVTFVGDEIRYEVR